METLNSLAAPGFRAILLFLLIQLGAPAIAIGTGCAVAVFKGWEAGTMAAIVAYFAIVKLLYLADLVSMIGKGTKQKKVKLQHDNRLKLDRKPSTN